MNKGNGKGAAKSKAQQMAKRPVGAIGYLCCPNVKNCTMASKGRAWIWDMGPGSKTDQVTCYECAYLFSKQRRKSAGGGEVVAAGGEGVAAGANSSSNNIKGGGKGGGKGGSRTPPNPLTSLNQGLLELDVKVLFEKLKVCKSTQELTSSLKDLCTPKAKVLTPSEELLKLGRFIKHNEMRELQLVNTLDNLKAGICEATKTLIGVQADLKDARVKHDLCLESLKSKQADLISQAKPGDDNLMQVDYQDPMDLGQEDKLALIQRLKDSIAIQAPNISGVTVEIGDSGDADDLEAPEHTYDSVCPYETNFPVFGKAATIHQSRIAPYTLGLAPVNEEGFVEELDRAEMSDVENLSNFGTPITPSIPSPEAYAALSQRAQLAISSELYGSGGSARPDGGEGDAIGVGDTEAAAEDDGSAAAAAPAPAAIATGAQHF